MAVAVENRQDLYDMSLAELEALVAEMGEPRYRARQIASWLYRKGARSLDGMTNLPQSLRKALADRVQVGRLRQLERQVSRDGTRKYLFAVPGNDPGTEDAVEAVLIPDGGRRTVCLSSQVGCAMGCTFCATGLMGLTRNLTAGEIVAQVAAIGADLGERISNVVLMGMGEPMANYDQVVRAIRLMNDPELLGLGARHITVSTAGLAPRIRRLAREGLQLTLAVSLHAATDAKRNELVPLNRRYPLAEVIDACRDYVEVTGRRVSLEYTLIDGVNDSLEDAEALARLLRGLLCHVNLIPLNPVPETGYARPAGPVVRAFAGRLRRLGLSVTVRKTMGTDIDAACGQLRRTRAR